MPAPAPCFIIGNWKMNGLSASLEVVDAVAAEADRIGDAVRCAICPPATLIDRAVRRAGARLGIGGQDCAAKASGAYTGDLSAEMLRDTGARLVIVGHSERRAGHGETDAIVRGKAEAALHAGLTAVICVGETRAEHDAGSALMVVGAQLEGSVPEVATAQSVVVAYEPVWCIGTGLVAGERDIERMHGFIRARLRETLGQKGETIAILYGGSVKPDNAGAIMRLPEVGGALVGGASLKAHDFIAIIAAAAAAGTARA